LTEFEFLACARTLRRCVAAMLAVRNSKAMHKKAEIEDQPVIVQAVLARSI
jgi:hypothetical protein